MAANDFDADVIVVGAGPVGLLLAAELRLGGAAVIVLEQRRTPVTQTRASTLHARTMEIFHSRGLLAALGEIPHEPMGHFGGIPLDLAVPSAYSGQWKVPQTKTEQLLGDWAADLGADIRRGWRVRELEQFESGVRVRGDRASGPGRLTARYLVACDGEDSTVRGLCAAEFPGRPATREILRADLTGCDLRPRRFERLPGGVAVAARIGAVTRVMVHEYGRTPRESGAEPDFAEVAATWQRVTGESIEHAKPVWLNAFDDTNRQVADYRAGRVLFAGDAAHRQMPSGGQALNLGLQDAVNLGWKLAAATGSHAPDGLLDTYHHERHPVGRRVLANIRAQTMLLFGGPPVEPLRDLLTELFGIEANRARLAGMISGVDIHYPVGDDAHPIAGTRMSDLTVPTIGAGRHQGAVLETTTGAATAAVAAWSDRVRVLHRPASGGTAELVLVRPDGYIAWAGTDPGDLEKALLRWFGAPRKEQS